VSLASAYAKILRDVFGEELRTVGPLEEGEVAVARGDTLLDDGDESHLKSEIPGVDDDRWKQFVTAMIVAEPTNVSPSNGVGMFSTMPRRLADLGLVDKLSRTRGPSGRMVWVAVFKRPLTTEKFLRSPQLQYDAFCKSMKDYDKKMEAGEIECDPKMSRSGALAVLHRAGPSGLENWKRGERFAETQAVHDRVAGVF
jgi:hypothetical protein